MGIENCRPAGEGRKKRANVKGGKKKDDGLGFFLYFFFKSCKASARLVPEEFDLGLRLLQLVHILLFVSLLLLKRLVHRSHQTCHGVQQNVRACWVKQLVLRDHHFDIDSCAGCELVVELGKSLRNNNYGGSSSNLLDLLLRLLHQWERQQIDHVWDWCIIDGETLSKALSTQLLMITNTLSIGFLKSLVFATVGCESTEIEHWERVLAKTGGEKKNFSQPEFLIAVAVVVADCRLRAAAFATFASVAGIVERSHRRDILGSLALVQGMTVAKVVVVVAGKKNWVQDLQMAMRC